MFTYCFYNLLNIPLNYFILLSYRVVYSSNFAHVREGVFSSLTYLRELYVPDKFYFLSIEWPILSSTYGDSA